MAERETQETVKRLAYLKSYAKLLGNPPAVDVIGWVAQDLALMALPQKPFLPDPRFFNPVEEFTFGGFVYHPRDKVIVESPTGVAGVVLCNNHHSAFYPLLLAEGKAVSIRELVVYQHLYHKMRKVNNGNGTVSDVTETEIRSMRAKISTLKRNIGDEQTPQTAGSSQPRYRYIQTVPSVGYRICGLGQLSSS